MLHDPSHITPPEVVREIELKPREREVLRKLAEEWAEAADDTVNAERTRLWTKLNDKDSERPMVWINEIPWHEMNVGEELTLQCEDAWARSQEDHMRKMLYQWRHLPGDMVINPWLDCPLSIHSTDFGIIEDVDLAVTDDKSDVVSRHFNIQIHDMDDLEKIQMPIITHNAEASQYRFEAMRELFSDILPVRKLGQTHIWFTPLDYLVRWWGVQELMMDLMMRPEMIHAFYQRMVDAWLIELDQFEHMNLLALDNNNTRIGSGGYGYSTELPGKEFDPNWVRPSNMWGCSNAQIFSEVSPEMHWEFSLEHDLPWLERWKMVYYGCCEPLSGKAELMKRIPNLRKVSISPWSNTKQAVETLGDDYVLSRKPSPSIFTFAPFDEAQARKEIREFLDQCGGQCHVELIMKDISTVKYHPQSLWKWEEIAMDEVRR